MAPLEITALTCGLCHTSGIAAWRSKNDTSRDVIFVSTPFLHDATAPETLPAFLCVACRRRAVAEAWGNAQVRTG